MWRVLRNARRTGYLKRIFDARRDTASFWDVIFIPIFVKVPIHMPAFEYRKYKRSVPVEKLEGTYTGFGLAKVVHLLMTPKKRISCRLINPATRTEI